MFTNIQYQQCAASYKYQPEYNVVVSDLTYVRVRMSWNYICVLVDLFNREIIGYSSCISRLRKLV